MKFQKTNRIKLLNILAFNTNKTLLNKFKNKIRKKLNYF